VRAYSRRMSGLMFLLVLTRPESLGLAPFLLIVGAVVMWARKRSIRAALRPAAISALTYAVTAAGLISWRLAYFGYPLPNSYYAKLSPHFWYNVAGGVKYVLTTLQLCPVAIPLLLAAGFLLIRAARTIFANPNVRASTLATFVVLAAAIALLGIAVVNGGDHFAQGRFLVQFNMLLPLPILALLPLPAWLTCAHRVQCLDVLAVVVAVAIDLLQLPAAEKLSDLGHEYRLAERGIEEGDMVNHALPGKDKPTLGVIMAGGIARGYAGYVVDLLGLNKPAIAHANQGLCGLKNHAAFHRPTFYQLQPDLIFPILIRTETELKSNDCRTLWGFENLVTRNIADEPEFKALYEPVSLVLRPGVKLERPDMLRAKPAFLRPIMEMPAAPGLGLHVYIKRSLLASVSHDLFDVVPLSCALPAASPPVKRMHIPALGWLRDLLPF
jgi:arabinofuranosyltransferase